MGPEQSSGNDGKKHWDLCHDIIQVYYSVYNELCFGFLEIVYEEAMEMALTQAGFRTARQVDTPIWFRGRRIGKYKADLIVNGIVLLELKATQALGREHEAQVLNYLRATDIEVALLVNFGPKPAFKRLVFENQRKTSRVHARSTEVPKK